MKPPEEDDCANDEARNTQARNKPECRNPKEHRFFRRQIRHSGFVIPSCLGIS